MVWRTSLHLFKNHYGTKSSRMLKYCHWYSFIIYVLKCWAPQNTHKFSCRAAWWFLVQKPSGLHSGSLSLSPLVCFWSIDELGEWEKNWNQSPIFQENAIFLVSPSFSDCDSSIYVLVHICCGAVCLGWAREVRIPFSTSQAHLLFVKQSGVFLVDFVVHSVAAFSDLQLHTAFGFSLLPLLCLEITSTGDKDILVYKLNQRIKSKK